MNPRTLIERPADDAQPGDVDAMRSILGIDDDENLHEIGYEPWPAERSVAYQLSRKIDRADWLGRRK